MRPYDGTPGCRMSSRPGADTSAEAEAKKVAANLGIGTAKLEQPVATISGGDNARSRGTGRILFAEPKPSCSTSRQTISTSMPRPGWWTTCQVITVAFF